MKISNEVLNVLEASEVKEGKFYLPSKQLERNLYTSVNKILECLGGKWNRKDKAHIFENDPAPLIDEAMLTGEVTDAKKEFQFFETPKEIALQMIEMAEYFEPESGDQYTTLEPSAGHGAIARHIPFEFGSTFVELDPKKATKLKEEFPGFHVECADFLEWMPGENMPKKFDRVIMNPPFSRQQDIDHVLRAIEFLSDRGRLISVMSNSVLFRENKKTVDFRNLIESMGGEFEELPEGAFKKSGTMVRACILRVDAAVRNQRDCEASKAVAVHKITNP